ncbi:MAG: acyltransferase [Pseudomonadota bacterium]
MRTLAANAYARDHDARGEWHKPLLPVAELSATRRVGRNGGIDVLRGWAVLSVILLHLNIRIPFDGRDHHRPVAAPKQSALGQRFPKPVSRLLVSGFSDPAPAASLAATVFSALTFRLNLLEAQVGYLPGAWDVLWSLCVEELFYLGFPVLARVARPRAVLYAVLIGFVVAGPFARVSKSSNEIWQDHSYLSCMGEIAIGCLAATLSRRLTQSRRAAGLLLFGGAGLMILVLYFRHAAKAFRLYEFGLDVTVLSCGTAAVLIAMSANPAGGRARGSRLLVPLRWLGRNSYEVYLSHLFVVFPASLVWKRFGNSLFIPSFYVLVVLTCALLGELMARGFSKPLSKRLRPAAL